VEAAIGIEPMNKGFAVRLSPFSLNVTEDHNVIKWAFAQSAVLSVSLYVPRKLLRFLLHPRERGMLFDPDTPELPVISL
jgi:hypothetical protein